MDVPRFFATVFYCTAGMFSACSGHSQSERAPGLPDMQRAIRLGAELFVDSTLSQDSSTSCATCHQPGRAFTENRAASRGVGVAARRRNAPSLINVAVFRSSFDWDGRAGDLGGQLQGVFSVTGDMGIDLGHAIKRVQRSFHYDSAFRSVFNRAPDIEAFIDALTALEKTLVARDSRFSHYYLGADSSALSLSEQRGFAVFRSAGCSGCHPVGPDPGGSGVIVLSDQKFHNIGVGFRQGKMKDLGRFEITGRPGDWGSFKTPSLHNVGLTGPYMHDGSLPTLESVVDFYSRGGVRNPNLDPVIVPRRLTVQQRHDLVAFLKSLQTDPVGLGAVGK